MSSSIIHRTVIGYFNTLLLKKKSVLLKLMKLPFYIENVFSHINPRPNQFQSAIAKNRENRMNNLVSNNSKSYIFMDIAPHQHQRSTLLWGTFRLLRQKRSFYLPKIINSSYNVRPPPSACVSFLFPYTVLLCPKRASIPRRSFRFCSRSTVF